MYSKFDASFGKVNKVELFDFHLPILIPVKKI